METKTFGGKTIRIRKLVPADIKNAKRFADYENVLIEEGAYIHAYKKVTIAQEKEWLVARLKKQKRGGGIFLVGEYGGRVVANARTEVYSGSWDHQAEFNIDIAQEVRGAGLGKYLTVRSIELARTGIKPKPVRLILGTMAENTAAIGLYEKSGFKKIAVIPGQHHYQGRFIDEVIMVYYL